MKISFLLNWYLNPYHAPIIVAKEMGFYSERNIDLAIIEPTNPSDVTHLIGQGDIPLGLKAMVHCYAARGRGFKVKSIGTLLDEPPTGLIALKHKNINHITDIKGKRIGYVGEFGKVMVDNLASEAGLTPNDYTTVRTGMDAAHALINDKVDAAIGLSCFQQVEIQEQGFESTMLRIDEAAHLGCCCFCSILFITHEKFIKTHPDLLSEFMRATLAGLQVTREDPEKALSCLFAVKPGLDTPLYKKIFYHTLPYFSRDLLNVERDWRKVGKYAQKLGIIAQENDFKECFTHAFAPVDLCPV
ncbi:MAG: ABC transporter substrate-binding protein [Proteobacteria bacterium]|nr:ABC transporter substrate-binding protein [Pseudomonadota bacterium]